MTSAVCTSCGATLEFPLACAACGPLAAEGARDPFAILGLERRYVLDQGDLRKRLIRCSRLLHPDFFATAASDVRQRAADNAAALNAAFEVLSDDYARADWLVRALGGPDQDSERQMPQEFLLEVLEWNETLEEAREGARERLEPLAAELTERRAATMANVASLLDPLPDEDAASLAAVRRHLNAVRYLDRALGTVRALRLESSNASFG